MCVNLVKISIDDNPDVESTLNINVVNSRHAKESQLQGHKQTPVPLIRKTVHR